MAGSTKTQSVERPDNTVWRATDITLITQSSVTGRGFAYAELYLLVTVIRKVLLRFVQIFKDDTPPLHELENEPHAFVLIIFNE